MNEKLFLSIVIVIKFYFPSLFISREDPDLNNCLIHFILKYLIVIIPFYLEHRIFRFIFISIVCLKYPFQFF